MIEIERSFAPEAIQQINVHIGLGDFKASGGGDQIQLRARIHSGDEADLEITQTNGDLHIRQRDISFRRPQPLDVELSLPAGRGLPLTATVGKGDISLTRVDGMLRVSTGKGDVAVQGGSGELRMQTGKGDIAASKHQGPLTANTGKGDVAITEGTGALRIQSGFGDVTVTNWQVPGENDARIEQGSGDCRVRGVTGGRLDIQTGRGSCALSQLSVARLRVQTAKGDVHAGGDPGTGDWQVTTAKGDILVQVPATVAARVEAATRRGTISSDLPQVRVGRPGPASMVGGGRSISVSGEEPRADIRLETVLGDIRVAATGDARRVAPASMPVPVEQPSKPPIVTPPPAPVAPQPVRKTAMEVLESLARREITVDEAEALLRSLEKA